LQVLQTTSTSSGSTTSTTFADVTGLSQTITPSASTSKVLVTVSIPDSGRDSSGTGGVGIKFNLLRGATTIVQMSNSHCYNGPGNQINANFAYSYLDSPATTSATTYKVQFASRTSGTTVYYNNQPETMTIIVSEIGA
jgi:hypothetical protein